MRFNRGHFFSALAGLIAGAFLIGALPGLAATGDVAVMGEWNRAGKQTVFTSGSAVTLQVRNTKTTGIPLRLIGDASVPPMEVTSHVMVENLNADLLDGMNGGFYRSLGRHCGNDNGVPPGTDYSCEMSITLDRPGTFYLSGTGKATGEGLLDCMFLLDGSPVDNSFGQQSVHTDEFGTCASSVGVEVAAGSRTVQFLLDPDPAVGPGVVSAFLIFIPSN